MKHLKNTETFFFPATNMAYIKTQLFKTQYSEEKKPKKTFTL